MKNTSEHYWDLYSWTWKKYQCWENNPPAVKNKWRAANSLCIKRCCWETIKIQCSKKKKKKLKTGKEQKFISGKQCFPLSWAQNSVIFLCVSAFLFSLWMDSSWAFCWASSRRAADSFSSNCFTTDGSLCTHERIKKPPERLGAEERWWVKTGFSTVNWLQRRPTSQLHTLFTFLHNSHRSYLLIHINYHFNSREHYSNSYFTIDCCLV